jgi:O-antigen/teichoic acid export membrane protein
MNNHQTRQVTIHLVQSGFGILSSVLGTIVIFILIARSLGPEEFGNFALVYALASLAGLVFDFGYPPRLLRETDALATHWGGLPLRVMHAKVVLLSVLTPTLFTAAWAIGLDPCVLAAIWAGIVLLSFGNVFAAMLRARGHHGRDAANLFAANASGALLALGLYAMSATPLAFALVIAAIGAAYGALTLLSWRRQFALVPERFSWASVGAELRAGLAYLLDAFTQRGFGFLDVAILAAVAPPLIVGLYQAGQKIALGAGLAAQPFNNVMLPRLSRLAATPAQWHPTALRFFAVQAGIGLAAFGLLAGLGPAIVDLVYTEAYAPVRGYMWLFGALVGARYVASSLGIMATSLGQQRQRAMINLAGLAAFAALAPVLATQFGARGMILAALLGALASASGLLLLLKRQFGWART